MRLSLDDGLGPIAVESRYREVLLVVESKGCIVGELWMPAVAVLPAADIAAAVTDALGDRLWRARVARDVERAAERAQPARRIPQPAVSVVVCTRNRAEQLANCLESLMALATRPLEILVVDNCPADDSTRRVCERFPVRYVLEDVPGASRARNRGVAEARGELIAFTDDDCVVDARWLDELGLAFSDQLVMAVTGYIGPAEIETRGQYLFEAHGGFEKHFQRRVFDGALVNPVTSAAPAGASANVVYRRKAFEILGGFAEDLGPGTPAGACEDAYGCYRILAAGYRIVFDPSRIVWHRHRADVRALRQLLYRYAAGTAAWTTRCLLRHREPAVLRVWRWWLRHHLALDLRRSLSRHERRVPLSVIAAEVAGIVAGPWRLLRSSTKFRAVAPIEISPCREPARPLEVGSADLSLTVALASRQRSGSLRRVLEGLAVQTYPPESFEAVLVLDGSTDDSAEMARSLELPFPLRVVEQEHLGLAAARNRGAREAAHPIVVFLDDDIVPEPQFLVEHATAHRASRGEHIALGYYPPHIPELTFWAYELRRWWEDHFRRKAERGHQWTFVDFADGNFSAPRGLIFDAGGWDESFNSGRRQDWEFGIRLLERGVRFAYYPGAMGRHYLDTSLETRICGSRNEGRDDVRLLAKHPHARARLELDHNLELIPAPDERSIAPALKRARRLEALRLRNRWRELVSRVLATAYGLGISDALAAGGLSDFTASPRDESSVQLVLALDDGVGLRIPPGAGSVEIVPRIAGRSVAPIEALKDANQWDWETIARRVDTQASEPLRERFVLAELERGLTPAVALTEGIGVAD